MMTSLCCDVLKVLTGKRVATAESCTGGGIGAALTSVPGSSAVYAGGVICYQNEVKEKVLGVDQDLLKNLGPVSAEVASAMAVGVKDLLQADVAVSVTGLAGPDADDFGNPVGTVFIGYCDEEETIAFEFHFEGGRREIRDQAIKSVLQILLRYNCCD